MARANLKLVQPEPPRCTDHDTVILPAAARSAYQSALSEMLAVRPAMDGMSTTEMKKRDAKDRMTRAAYRLLDAAEALGA